MRVLLIEDDSRTASFLTKGLREAGFVVDHEANGTDGQHRLLREGYDLAIVDLMLPGTPGLAIVKAARDARVTTPVLILSARDTVDDKVEGLRAGGDDYLTKPFSFTELLWRLHALARRAQQLPAPTLLTCGDLQVDTTRRTVTRAGQRIDLQPREFMLLEYLLRNAGRLVTKTMIIEHVWDYDFDPQTNVVEARVSRLRSKIDAPFARPLIHTIRGAGYILRADET